MYLKNRSIEFSLRDMKRNIKIPSFLTAELAEIVGIIIGDGNLYEYKVANKTIITFSGENPEDLEYYNTYVIPLIGKIFNIKPSFREYDNWFSVRIFSRAIFTFFTRTINIPSGKKAKIVVIPSLFFNNSQFLLSVIRGIGDTDFSLTFKRKNKKLHYYPVIKLYSASKTLVGQLSEILSLFGFNLDVDFDRKTFDNRTGRIYTKSHLYLSGNKNLELWIKLIGFSNPKNLTKYLVWKKFGFCPPKTNLMTRRNILNGDVNPQSFYI